MWGVVKLRRTLSASPSWVRHSVLLGVDALIGIASFVERVLRGMEEYTPREPRDFCPARTSRLVKRQLPLMLVVALAIVSAVLMAVL
jgi:hypothetical protein